MEEGSNLPLMLSSGPEEVSRVVRNNLERCFDCIVGAFSFPQAELKWMSAAWIALSPKDGEEVQEEEAGTEDEEKPEGRKVKDDEEVCLTYTLPDPPGEGVREGIKKFDLRLRQSQLVKVWKRYEES